MKYEKINEYDENKFRRITGVKRATFEKMVEILKKSYAEKHKRRGRKPKLSIENQLLAALEYWREYRTYAHIAASYGIAESNIYRSIKWIENTSTGKVVLSLEEIIGIVSRIRKTGNKYVLCTQVRKYSLLPYF